MLAGCSGTAIKPPLTAASHPHPRGTCSSFGDEDATVACRQLGYGVLGMAKSYSFFGDGVGPIWLDQVNCTGAEEALEQCAHSGWGMNNCQHRCVPQGGSAQQPGKREVPANRLLANGADCLAVCLTAAFTCAGRT
jgi:hypothetical protein